MRAGTAWRRAALTGLPVTLAIAACQGARETPRRRSAEDRTTSATAATAAALAAATDTGAAR